MSRNCFNCTWYYNKRCNNDRLPLNVHGKMGSEYIEDGSLSGVLKESMDTVYLVQTIMDELKEKDFLKVKADISKLDLDYIENIIIEHIGETLYNSLDNYFSGEGNTIEVKDPDNFKCNQWR